MTEEKDTNVDDEELCPECGEPLVVVLLDDGIGAYEYWGQVGFDSRRYWGCKANYCYIADYTKRGPYNYED